MPIKTTYDISSQSLRDSHKRSLYEVINTIDEIPVEIRDISSVTMAINPE